MVLKSTQSRVVDGSTARVGRLFAPIPIRPNTWTLLSLLPAFGGFIALSQGMIVVGLLLFSMAGFLDIVDGAVARARNESTPFGAYLDGMIDRFVEAMLLFGLMIFGYPDWLVPGWFWLAMLLFFGSAMTSFARAYADHRGMFADEAELASMGGILERAERLLVVFASMLVWLVEPLLATYVIVIGTVLAVLTVIQRMGHVRRAAEPGLTA